MTMSIIAWIVIGLVVSLVWKIFVGVWKLVFGLVVGIGALMLFGLPCLFLVGISSCVFSGVGRLMRGAY